MTNGFSKIMSVAIQWQHRCRVPTQTAREKLVYVTGFRDGYYGEWKSGEKELKLKSEYEKLIYEEGQTIGNMVWMLDNPNWLKDEQKMRLLIFRKGNDHETARLFEAIGFGLKSDCEKTVDSEALRTVERQSET